MNTYHCIIGFLAEAPELRDSIGGQEIPKGLLRRIELAASLSNAIFGWAHAPGFMRQRLTCLCEDVLTLLSNPDATLDLCVTSEKGVCPPSLETVVLRVAPELVGNAVRHGARGRIEVMLRTDYGRTVLTVSDDRRDGADARPLDDLSAAARLARQNGGSVRLLRQRDHTIAKLELPHGAERSSWRTLGALCAGGPRL